MDTTSDFLEDSFYFLLIKNNININNALLFKDLILKEIDRVPKGFWCEETKIEAIKYLILIDLRWNRETVCKELSVRLIDSKGFRSIRKDIKLIDLVIKAFPNEKYHKWEFKKVPDNTWDDSTVAEATRWLVEDKLETTPNVFENLNNNIFSDFGLGNMFKLQNHNKQQVLSIAYPK